MINLENPGKVSLIILTRNGLEYTQQCLESIFLKTIYPDYEIIVVDNASEDGTPEFLSDLQQTHPNLITQVNEQNEGFARGNNQGASIATGEYLVFLNNDTIVTIGWLTQLINHLNDPAVGMVGPVTNSASNEARIKVDYESLDNLDQFAAKYTQLHFDKVFEIKALAFYCVALRKQVFEKIGPLDERFGLGMFEDDDYALRVKKAGYKVLCAEDVYIHHWGGASFLKLDPYQYWLLFKENRGKFEDKWNITWQPHLQRAELLPEQVIQLSEWAYRLQWQVISQSPDEKADIAFSKVVDELIEQNRTIELKDQKINSLETTLNEIYKSKGWKLVQMMWKTKLAIIPPGSPQETLFARWMNRSTQPAPVVQPKKPQPVQSQATHLAQKKNWSSQKTKATTDQQVAILAPQFFDYEGRSIYIGGAERYLMELVNTLRAWHREPIVFQSAVGDWEQEYAGIPFIGLNSHGNIKKLNVLFHDRISERTPVIYLAFNLAAPYCNDRSVGISHGVFWDHDHYDFGEERKRSFEFLLDPIANLTRLVSVDTNTINWLRTVRPQLAEKCVYIPNFVNLDEFKPATQRSDNTLVVLYPRRLYPPRGFWLVHEIAPEFLESYPQLEFHFVGQADPEEQVAVQNLIEKFPGRVIWQTLEMQAMHQAYEQADITLIPTVHSEGTSLSCLEAMAAGNAVIATNIGGLPDLVISGYNGLLIEPSSDELRVALHRLCTDPGLRNVFSQHARAVASSFDLISWQNKWETILQDIL